MKKRSLVWSVLGAAVLLACAGSRASLAVEPNQGTNLLYVCNQAAATISVIDMDRNIVVKTIDLQALGLPATSKPHHVQVEPDGSYYYVSLIGANTVLKFDRSDELVGRVEFEVPGLLQLDVHSDRLYVGRSMAAVKSFIATVSALRLVATSAASLTRLERSAPVKPGVSEATCSASTSGSSVTF